MRHPHHETPAQSQRRESRIAREASRITDYHRRGVTSRETAEHELRLLDCFEAEIEAWLGPKQ